MNVNTIETLISTLTATCPGPEIVAFSFISNFKVFTHHVKFLLIPQTMMKSYQLALGIG